MNKKLYLKDLVIVFKDEELFKSILVRPDKFKKVDKNFNKFTTLINLNNPQKMNAMDMMMSKELFSWDKTYEYFPYTLPIFKGVNHKVFSSGADLNLMYNSRNKLDDYFNFHNLSYFLFHKSYEHNKNNKNIICIWDGVVMGGGLGIGIFSKFKIATESTTLAMPESQFGFFANCNFSHFIHKFVNLEQALHMSIFGNRYKGYEVYNKKFATNFVLNKYLDEMIHELDQIEYVYEREEKIKDVIEHFQKISITEYKDIIYKVQENLKKSDEFINNLFIDTIDSNTKNFEEFYDKLLQKLKSDKKYENLNEYFKNNSLLTNKLNYEVAKNSFDPSLTYEDRFNLDQDYAEISIKVGNMFEGIRAYFIEKDKKPKWKITNFEELKTILNKV